MLGRLMKYGILCLAIGCWHSGVQAALLPGASWSKSWGLPRAAYGIQVQSEPMFAMATLLESEAQAADRQFEQLESRSQRASRMNRNLLMVTIAILTLFVIFRLILHWQISRERKKQTRVLLEGEL